MERLVDGLAPGPVLAHSEATSPAPRSRFLAGGLVMAGLLANLLAFLFFGFIHQAAPIGASLFLRRMAPGRCAPPGCALQREFRGGGAGGGEGLKGRRGGHAAA